MRVVDVVDVRGSTIICARTLAVAAAFLARELVHAMRMWELRLLLLRLLLGLLQVGSQDVHHGFRVAHLGLPVVRLRVQLREALHELVVLQLRLLQFGIFLAELPGECLLHGRHQLVRVPLSLLVQEALELLILRITELR